MSLVKEVQSEQKLSWKINKAKIAVDDVCLFSWELITIAYSVLI